MTGLEVLFLLGCGASSFIGGVLLWVVVVEKQKSALLDALARERPLLAERNGNIDRPVGMTLQGRSCVVDVDAVVRGDHALWHLRALTDVAAAVGTVVIVDVEWQEAVWQRRGLAHVGSITPRLLVYASDVSACASFLERARDELCAVLLTPGPAKCLVVDSGAVFLELPRVGLEPVEARLALQRVEDAVDVVAGRAIDRARAITVDVAAHAPSGAPLAIALPQFSPG